MSVHTSTELPKPAHAHVFLGAGHERNERRTWLVIALCGAMMLLEIFGGLLSGSIALVADGLHMSTHAGALLLAALAYRFSRRYAHDPRFSFGTGKLGDLAGFTSAIILAVIALLIGFEALRRLMAPVAIQFAEAIPIAFLGLTVNVVSAWLLGGGHDHGHGHGHGHRHSNAHDHEGHGESRRIQLSQGAAELSIFETDAPPRFRLRPERPHGFAPAEAVSIETVREDGGRQTFRMLDRGDFLESAELVPEPHEFVARVLVGDQEQAAVFREPGHNHAHHRDNNMRAAIIHVLADAAVSVLVIVGLLLARLFGWLWMDPLAGIVGAFVIASWSYGLIRDTGAILLDMNPDRRLSETIRRSVESQGDRVSDLHLWRLGPGHLGAIVAVVTDSGRDAAYYREQLRRLPSISHLTVEVARRGR